MAEAISKIKAGARDMLASIKNIIRGEGYYEFATPDGMIFRITDDEIPAASKGIIAAESEMEAEIAETSLSSIVRDISGLNNTANFKPGSLEHILEGEINASGKAVGYHYEGFPTTKGNIIAGTETTPNSFGVYKAKVEVNGVPKISNDGYSTFFPKNMTAQQIVDSINEAFASKTFVRGNTFRGMTSRGFEIDMYIDEFGKIISAFPVM